MENRDDEQRTRPFEISTRIFNEARPMLFSRVQQIRQMSRKGKKERRTKEDEDVEERKDDDGTGRKQKENANKGGKRKSSLIGYGVT